MIGLPHIRFSASISSACFIDIPSTQRHCKTPCRLDSNSLLFPVSSSRRPINFAQVSTVHCTTTPFCNQLLRHRLYFRLTPSCRPSFASFTSLLALRNGCSSKLIPRKSFFFSFFSSNQLAFDKMTPFSAGLLRHRFNAVIVSIQSLPRLACRLSALPRRFRVPASSNFPSPNTVARLSFPLSPTRHYFRLVHCEVPSLSHKFPRRTAQHPLSVCICSDTDSTSASLPPVVLRSPVSLHFSQCATDVHHTLPG
jgi:hypothetical protein